MSDTISFVVKFTVRQSNFFLFNPYSWFLSLIEERDT